MKTNRRIFYKKPILVRIYDKYFLHILLTVILLALVGKILAHGFRMVL